MLYRWWVYIEVAMISNTLTLQSRTCVRSEPMLHKGKPERFAQVEIGIDTYIQLQHVELPWHHLVVRSPSAQVETYIECRDKKPETAVEHIHRDVQLWFGRGGRLGLKLIRCWIVVDIGVVIHRDVIPTNTELPRSLSDTRREGDGTSIWIGYGGVAKEDCRLAFTTILGLIRWVNVGPDLKTDWYIDKSRAGVRHCSWENASHCITFTTIVSLI